MTFIAMFAIGILLTQVINPGKTAAKFQPFTEADFAKAVAK